MSAQTHLTQPWEPLGLDQETYLSWARRRASEGKTFVTETLVNGYMNGDGEWFADSIVLRDATSGNILVGYDPYEDGPGLETDDFIVISRHVL